MVFDILVKVEWFLFILVMIIYDFFVFVVSWIFVFNKYVFFFVCILIFFCKGSFFLKFFSCWEDKRYLGLFNLRD